MKDRTMHRIKPSTTSVLRIRDAAVAPTRRSIARLAGLGFLMAIQTGTVAWANPSMLPIGRSVSPLGSQQEVGSMPVNMVLTPNGHFAIVTDCGFRQYLSCINTSTGKLALPIISRPATPSDGSIPAAPISQSILAFPNKGRNEKSNGLYYGLAVEGNSDGTATIYASQGANASIAVVHVSTSGALSQIGVVKLRPTDFVAGLAIDSQGMLYAAINDYNSSAGTDAATTPGSMVAFDTRAVGVVQSDNAKEPSSESHRTLFNGPAETFGVVGVLDAGKTTSSKQIAFTPSNYPYAVACTHDGSSVFVTSQRDGVVYRISPSGAESNPVRIPTGAHPSSLLLSSDESVLYVTNAQSDTVSIIHLNDNSVKDVSLAPAGEIGKLQGVSPNGMALSKDNNTLYVALSDMNAVAVVDTRISALQGYIPAGWYPTSVVSSGTGPDAALLVANGKGSRSSNPNPRHVKPTKPSQSESTYYAETIIEGTVSRFSLRRMDLRTQTNTVLRNCGLLGPGINADRVPSQIRGLKGIQHVIYIVKENRTYDQVLGDVPGGNGDSRLTLFGKTITPNQHALADRFVLLDNFYDCGEVSPDGWNWSTQAISNEFIIKNVPYNYSVRGRDYDFEGSSNNYPTSGFPAFDADGNRNSILFPNGAPSVPDPGEARAGHIWDLVHRSGLTYRNYGFWESDGIKGILPDNFPASKNLQPAKHYSGGSTTPAKIGYTDPDFRTFDTSYPDSSAPKSGYVQTTYGKYASPSRFDEWHREFLAMLQNDPTGSSVPAFMMVRFMSDHTAGFQLGKATPAEHVADNDYAVGQLVQEISKSPIWKSTAIFVIEDDAQDGPDHVDCHRSTAYVISPWIKKHSVDHGFYNTDSILHSMEVVLGLPPLTQYDAIAPVIADFNDQPSNDTVFSAKVPDRIQEVVAAHLPKEDPRWKLAKATSGMDFHKEDLADPQMLNQVIWQSVRGTRSKMPSSVHTIVPSELTRPSKGSNQTARKTALDKD